MNAQGDQRARDNYYFTIQLEKSKMWLRLVPCYHKEIGAPINATHTSLFTTSFTPPPSSDGSNSSLPFDSSLVAMANLPLMGQCSVPDDVDFL